MKFLEMLKMIREIHRNVLEQPFYMRINDALLVTYENIDGKRVVFETKCNKIMTVDVAILIDVKEEFGLADGLGVILGSLKK